MSKPWSTDATFDVRAGMHSSTDSRSPIRFTLELHDSVSGLFVATVIFEEHEFMRALSGTHLSDIKGELATARVYQHWNHVPVRDQIAVPREVTASLYGDKAERAALDWFEDHPGSGLVDSYTARLNTNTRSYVIYTISYVPKDEYDATMAVIEESEEIDPDDDGLDDDTNE